MRPDVIAHYQVGEKLGQGGMGEVYRATDTKLGRTVALKFLPDNVANNPMHMGRFTREAQTLASLNHPNIATIYGVEDRAIVMELVEGQTLSERIKEGPIPLDEALDIARQIADALEAAHDKGIVHRDLKPANIKITPSGTVKVLDFGLAKVAEAPAVSLEESPTIATTQAGIILGTAGYMSPEQARGRDVDKRADIWAFGVVLYEMLTGTQLFQGDTVTDVMAAVVRQDPDLSRVPSKVRPLLRRCLEKDPKRRLRDIGDSMLLLDAVAEPTSVGSPNRSGGSRAAWAAAGAFAVALGALAVVHFRETSPVRQVVRFQLEIPEDFSPTGAFAISPDGRQMAYGSYGPDGVPHILVRSLDTIGTRALPGSQLQRTSPVFWSPDSRFLAFWVDGELKRIGIEGGPAQTIADAPNGVLGGAWNADGVIVFGATGGVMRVDAAGGTPARVTKAAVNESHVAPQFLPDGRHFLYLRRGAVGNRSLQIGSLDAAPDEQEQAALLKTDFVAQYAAGPDPNAGQLLFVRDDTLVGQAFDATRRQLSGAAVPVAEDLAINPNEGTAIFSVSDTGTLIYFKVAEPSVQLTWFDREGRSTKAPVEPGRAGTMTVSPDGTRAAVARADDNGNNDIWQIDLVSGRTTRFTFDAGPDFQPVWSSDGKRIAWTSVRNGVLGLYAKQADGSGEDELLYRFAEKGPAPALTDWTADGRFLVYAWNGDIWAAPVAEGTLQERRQVPIVQSRNGQAGARVSPDGRWVAYISSETGRQELFVQPFALGIPERERPVGKWMVSNGTLGMARWSGDGRELLFLGLDGGVMSMDVARDPVFRASRPRVLFQLPRLMLSQGQTPGGRIDVPKDHQRFLVSMPTASEAGLNVVLNWQADLAPGSGRPR